MKITFADEKNRLEQQLQNCINTLINPILFDITLDRKSQRILMLSENGSFILSYSRPLFLNVFKPPLAEYEFVFSLERDAVKGIVTLVGKIKLKKYVVGAILCLFMIFLYKGYNIAFGEEPMDYLFVVVMPLVIYFLLFLEYLFFKRRIKMFLNSLIKLK